MPISVISFAKQYSSCCLQIYRTYRQLGGMEIGKIAGVHDGNDDEIPHDYPCFW
jgi:hypothetical protein